MISLETVKKAIKDKGFSIEVERYTQDIIINIKLIFSTNTNRKTILFTNKDLDYVNEVDKLLNIIYIKEQGGAINPNYSLIIYNLQNNENMFPILYKKIFESSPVDIKYWAKEEILNAIEDHIYHYSELCLWDAKNGQDKLLSYSISVEYPKIVLEIESDPIDKSKISVGSYYITK